MDSSAVYCASCGAPVSGGRFCTSCGAPIGALAATSVREPAYATPPAPAPPSPPAPPIPARPPTSAPVSIPEPEPEPEPEPTQMLLPEPPPPPAPPPAREPTAAPTSPPGRGGPGPGLWLGAAAVLVVIVLLGAWLLLRGGFGGPSTAGNGPLVPSASPTTQPPSGGSASASGPTSPTATPGQVGKAADVAGLSRATAPTQAPPGLDLAGNPVTYGADNLVDGARDTCWRVPGDATGTVLTFRLDRPTRLTKVGLVNGYAKTAFSGGRRFDWYAGNRRVLSVDWIFDDGSSVSQTFSSTRAMQSMAIDPVTTSTVRVEITAVSPPGHGPAARDDTAISEVSLVGRPG